MKKISIDIEKINKKDNIYNVFVVENNHGKYCFGKNEIVEYVYESVRNRIDYILLTENKDKMNFLSISFLTYIENDEKCFDNNEIEEIRDMIKSYLNKKIDNSNLYCDYEKR